jgi:hypothetical protein
VFAFCLPGCKPARKSAALPFENVQLEMPLDQARKLIGRDGTPTEHAKLPFSLLPRDGYKGIPEATQYFVWWNPKTGIPELTLGVFDGKVIYKDVEWDENGQRKGERHTLPKYQQ